MKVARGHINYSNQGKSQAPEAFLKAFLKQCENGLSKLS